MSDILKLSDISSLKAHIVSVKSRGEKIGFVPTMGALHEGHLSLIKHAHKNASHIIASIFVNPTQFGAGEDLNRYPRPIEADLVKLHKAGVQSVFLPDVKDMYPQGFSTRVEVDTLGTMMEGAARAGHFHGVTLVVAKLFNLVQPDVAVFGEKDWQQLAIIKRMVLDLDFPTQIIAAPTIRDEYGLALSSRNSYLSEKELQIARKLNGVLNDLAQETAHSGFTDYLHQKTIDTLLTAGFSKIDYLECRDSYTLTKIDANQKGEARLFIAAYIGKTRLIDNVKITLL